MFQDISKESIISKQTNKKKQNDWDYQENIFEKKPNSKGAKQIDCPTNADCFSSLICNSMLTRQYLAILFWLLTGFEKFSSDEIRNWSQTNGESNYENDKGCNCGPRNSFVVSKFRQVTDCQQYNLRDH